MASTTLSTTLERLDSSAAYDLVVLGSGAGGMAAALYGGIKGKKVLLVENTRYVGGTTALSGGTTWVPLTRYLQDTDTADSADKVMEFLDAAVGTHAPRALREALVKHGKAAIDTLVDNSDVDFRACAYHPDYLSELPGATVNGRALEPLPYITRHLGKDLALLRPPIPEFTVLGGMMVNREDIGHLLKRFKSPESFKRTVSLVSNFAWDKLRYGKTARSVMGHALIARMLASLKQHNVTLLTDTQTTDLHQQDGRVTGVTLQQHGTTRTLQTRLGVVLASGGFGRSPERRQRYFSDSVSPYSPAADGHQAALHPMVEKLGGHYSHEAAQPAFWAPVSVRRYRNGREGVFPHFVFDRSKPGTVCVDRQGNRFVNESLSYHDFCSAMLAGGDLTRNAWIVCDATAIAKYGLGHVRLGGDTLKPYLNDGYLLTGSSLTELAGKLEVPAANLQRSVDAINRAAVLGEDPDYQRGSTVYQRNNGDPDHKPNPTLGTIGQAPFYAVKLHIGDIGTATGLVTDANANVLDQDNHAIAGLYACGNDMQSVMGGTYPGPGITIGPAIVFAFLAVEHATQQ